MILNLAIWFALHTLFGRVEVVRPGFGLRLELPVWASVNPAAVGLATAALVHFKAGLIPVLLAAAAAGIGLHLVGLA